LNLIFYCLLLATNPC